MEAGAGCRRVLAALDVELWFAGRKSAVADMELDVGQRAAGRVGNISAPVRTAHDFFSFFRYFLKKNM